MLMLTYLLALASLVKTGPLLLIPAAHKNMPDVNLPFVEISPTWKNWLVQRVTAYGRFYYNYNNNTNFW